MTRSDGMADGAPAVMLSGGVVIQGLPRPVRVRMVISARILLQAAVMVHGKHGPIAGFDWVLRPIAPVGAEFKGVHRGVSWHAVHVEHLYLIRFDGCPGIGLAFNEVEVEGVAASTIDANLAALTGDAPNAD